MQAPSEKPRPAPVAATSNKPKAQPPKPAKRDLSSSVSIPEGLRPIKERFSSGEIAIRPNEESPEFGSEADMSRLLRVSPQMVEVRHLVRRLARSSAPVYISGESGTGREQAARIVHEFSDQADKPFIAVSCGAIPENLIESESSGYKKDSFTGADQGRLGFFQHVDDGALLLGEVADLPLAVQVRLLRVIQGKAVRHIGDARETFVDARIICVAHKNLEALVESGVSHQSLCYRLNAVTLHMPPLREMRGDVGALILYPPYKHRRGTQTYKFSPKVWGALLHYSYPGNFRKLESILERAVALIVGQVTQPDDLQIQKVPLPKENHQNGDVTLDDVFEPERQQMQPGNSSVRDAFSPFNPRTIQIQDCLNQIERDIIEQALQQTRYNRMQATKSLGISFRSIRYRMERLDIN